MREASEPGVRVVRRGDGFCAAGPGFYVWDLEARAVIETALELVDRTTRPRDPKIVRLRGRRRARSR